MAQVNGQADNHKAESQFVSQNLWGTDVRIDGELVRRNLQTIKQNIAPCKPRIIGVTKYYGLDAITAGYEAGLRDFGESRALDAIGKIENLQDDVMIQVIAYLKDIEIKSKKDEQKKALDGLETVLKFAGTLPEDFDYKKELAQAREEKYGNIS